MSAWRRMHAWIAAPGENPVLRHELRRFARRATLPWAVTMLTAGVTLAIASAGGRESALPAATGRVLFQTFFGLAHGLVLLAGPAVAAGSIASEREGQTLEALALTGMSAGRIARGKFMAAMVHLGTYVVALAPAGALPFLFGGVTTGAVLAGFALLAVTTVLATLLGLAISARVPTTRAALTTSVVAGAVLSGALYAGVGQSLGDTVCESAGLARPGTMWLPVVLADGNLSTMARITLAAVPLALAGFAAWFLLEVCTAGLADPTADRSSGLKRWFTATTIAGALVGVIAVLTGADGVTRAENAVDAIVAYAGFGWFGALLFQGDAVVPPWRVRMQWKRAGTGAVRRFFGPGVSGAAAMQILAAALFLGATSLAGVLGALDDEYAPMSAPMGVIAMAAACAAWVLLSVGVATWSRVRFGTAAGRAVLASVALVVVVAPFAMRAVFGAAAWAAPSPAFAYETAQTLASGQGSAGSLAAVLISAAVMALVGLVALIAASGRIEATLSTLDAEAARAEALIAAEDAPKAGA